MVEYPAGIYGLFTIAPWEKTNYLFGLIYPFGFADSTVLFNRGRLPILMQVKKIISVEQT